MEKWQAVYAQGPLYSPGDPRQEKPHYYVRRCDDFTELKPGDVLSQEQVDQLAARRDVRVTIEAWGR